MNAPESLERLCQNGQDFVNRGKTAPKPPLERQKVSLFETSTDNSRFGGCCADLP